MANNVEIQGIEFQIRDNSTAAVQSLDRLTDALSRLKTATKGGVAGVNTTARQLSRLNVALSGLSANNNQKLTQLSAALSTLKTTEFPRISSSFANQILAITRAIDKIKWTDGDKLETLANGLKPLSEIGRSNLSSTITQLKKLPDIINNLEEVDLDKFIRQMKELADALQPFADQMSKVAAGFAAFPSRIQKVISSTAKYNQVMKSVNSSNAASNYLFTGVKWGVVYAGLRQFSDLVSTAITKSNEYQESLNLFTVAMGEYAESAKAFAEMVGQAMGIDPADWMYNQGVFNTLLTGFGNASEQAAIMSKNLTQLGYDLSSFFNISVEDAMQKLQSGISGELEPLRRLGYDLSQARLEAVALSLGIEKSVTSMTQAEKAQLRYYAIMTQVTTAQGDLARTLESPANQLRILEANLTQAARAIGNIFIPALNAILPVAIAVLQVFRDLANSIAAVFGFSLTEVDYDSVVSGNESVSGSFDDVADSVGGAAKALKSYTLGIDELNVIDPTSGGGGGGGYDTSDSFLLDELPTYNFLQGIAEKAESLKDVLKEIVELLAIIGVTAGLMKLASILEQMAGWAGTIMKLALSGVVVALEFMLVSQGIKDYITGKDLWSLVESLIVVGASSAILWKMWGATGAAIGLAVGAIAVITGLGAAIDEGADIHSFEVQITTMLSGLLGGLSGIFLAKQIGISPAAGAAIGIGVAMSVALMVTNVTAIRSGQLEVTSIETMFNALLSSAFAGIAGVAITGTVQGFVIGVGVGLAINIISLILADQSRKNLEMISRVFGDISLSTEEIALYAQKFVDSDMTKELEQIASMHSTLDGLVTTLKTDLETLTNAEYLLDIGLEDEASFQSKVKAFADSAQNTLNQFAATVNVGFTYFGVDASNLTASTELAQEMQQLNTALGDMFVDGTFMEDGQVSEKAQEIINRIKEITNLVNTAMLNAEMTVDLNNLQITDLDQETLGKVTEQLVEILTKGEVTIDESITANIAAISLQDDLSEEEKQAKIDELFAGAFGKKLEYSDEVVGELQNIMLKFSEETGFDFSGMFEENGDQFNESLRQAIIQNNQLYQWSFSDFIPKGSQIDYTVFDEEWMEAFKSASQTDSEKAVKLLYSAMSKSLSGEVPEEVKVAAKTVYESIQPLEEYYLNIRDQAEEYGLEVPEGISRSLTDIQQLKALSGDADAISYLLGASFTTNEAFLWMLSTVEGAGGLVDETTAQGIKDNMHLIQEAVDNGLIEMTPTLVENLKLMGIEFPPGFIDGFDTGVEENKEELKQSGIDMTEHVESGISEEISLFDSVSLWVQAVGESIEKNRSGLSTQGQNMGSIVGGAFTTAVQNAISQAQLALSQAVTTANQTISNIASKWGLVEKEINSASKSAPKQYAEGGFPDQGQLFIARERGPEMVGSIGHRAAVANNDQIVEAIASGVYEAVSAANTGNAPTSFNIYIDGKQVEASVRSTRQQRGAVIATGGIINYG